MDLVNKVQQVALQSFNATRDLVLLVGRQCVHLYTDYKDNPFVFGLTSLLTILLIALLDKVMNLYWPRPFHCLWLLFDTLLALFVFVLCIPFSLFGLSTIIKVVQIVFDSFVSGINTFLTNPKQN
ncbi:hypothetical protein HAT2_00147 [Candidatus Similichlamydia laticola]|uniref:Uncharacterized protein n=1 Tax=Candidatus Similichlamydia laticola TaxID=2170265 RepID=A0A369KFT7_9BACT|nr:hypothetical protein HAT2_00147 [Candidatus Similichlamydia laticola]